MKDDELFLKALKEIKNQMVEERSEISRTDEINSQIAAEYDEGIEILGRVVPLVKSVDDVWALEEADFVYVLECFEKYSENFIIDGRSEEKLKADEAEFSQLQDILYDFYEDDDDENSDEYEDEDSESEEDE